MLYTYFSEGSQRRQLCVSSLAAAVTSFISCSQGSILEQGFEPLRRPKALQAAGAPCPALTSAVTSQNRAVCSVKGFDSALHARSAARPRTTQATGRDKLHGLASGGAER